MRSVRRSIACTAASLALAGCSTLYQPMVLDNQTGLYETSTAVDPGGVRTQKLNGKLGDFGAVLLVVDSNLYPSRYEFTLRKVLAELGHTRVINVTEFRAWAKDRQFDLPIDTLTLEHMRQFSNRVSPLLVVSTSYQLVGDARHQTTLQVIDGRNGTPLLSVDHPRMVWMHVDREAIYPVLNELRKWHRTTSQQTTGGTTL